MATVIHTWEEFEEWATKHPETEVATITVNSKKTGRACLHQS